MKSTPAVSVLLWCVGRTSDTPPVRIEAQVLTQDQAVKISGGGGLKAGHCRTLQKEKKWGVKNT